MTKPKIIHIIALMIEEHLILFLAWLLFYALHSLFASHWMKAKIKIRQNIYRLIYSILATLLFFAILILTASTYSLLIFAPNNISIYIGLMLSAVGLFVVKRAFRNYSLKAFLGIKSEAENPELATTGIQSKLRHPVYLGTLLLLLGYFIFNPQISSLIIFISTCIYLPFGIRREEKKLTELFGEKYIAYKKVTPSLFPRFKL